MHTGKQQVFLMHPETVTPGKAQLQGAEMPLTNSFLGQFGLTLYFLETEIRENKLTTRPSFWRSH